MSLSRILHDAEATVDLFDRAAEAMRASPLRAGSIVRLPARGRLLATGDLHDNPIHFAKIKALAKLDQSPDHHVILHELIHSERLVDGVDISHRMLARVADLVLQFPQQAHPLLANHELAQMIGRGVSKGAGDGVKLFKDGLEYAFHDEADIVGDAINRFIRAMPLALVSDSGLLCAHSLPAPHVMEKFDAGVLERDLDDADYEPNKGSAYLMVWGRGHKEEQIAQLAARWKVTLFILGHEHADAGVDRKSPIAIVLNSDHEQGVVVPIDLANLPSADEVMMSVLPLRAIGLPEDARL